MAHLTFSLPWPPSANHAWRAVSGKVLQSEDYRAYKKSVGDAVLEHYVKRHWTRDRLAIALRLKPPNARSYDIDNRIKTLLDSLVGAGVIYDDRDIDSILVVRGAQQPPHGSVLVRIDEISTLSDARKFDSVFDGDENQAANDPHLQRSML